MSPPSPRVLIVDDDPAVREAVRRSFERAGFMVSILDTGFGVASEAHRWNPDVILLDLGMPGLDGEHVLRILKSFKDHGLADIPVVFWSGRVQSELDAVAARTSARVVSKSTPMTELIAIVRDVVLGLRERAS